MSHNDSRPDVVASGVTRKRRCRLLKYAFDAQDFDVLQKHYTTPRVLKNPELGGGMRLRQRVSPAILETRTAAYIRLKKEYDYYEKRDNEHAMYCLLKELSLWEMMKIPNFPSSIFADDDSDGDDVQEIIGVDEDEDNGGGGNATGANAEFAIIDDDDDDDFYYYNGNGNGIGGSSQNDAIDVDDDTAIGVRRFASEKARGDGQSSGLARLIGVKREKNRAASRFTASSHGMESYAVRNVAKKSKTPSAARLQTSAAAAPKRSRTVMTAAVKTPSPEAARKKSRAKAARISSTYERSGRARSHVNRSPGAATEMSRSLQKAIESPRGGRSASVTNSSADDDNDDGDDSDIEFLQVVKTPRSTLNPTAARKRPRMDDNRPSNVVRRPQRREREDRSMRPHQRREREGRAMQPQQREREDRSMQSQRRERDRRAVQPQHRERGGRQSQSTRANPQTTRPRPRGPLVLHDHRPNQRAAAAGQGDDPEVVFVSSTPPVATNQRPHHQRKRPKIILPGKRTVKKPHR